MEEKRRCLELEAHLTVMEKILEEFRNVRHQYNNMFQSIVFYIENEQWVLNKEFINEIMEKSSEINENNTLQLINIKNCTLRCSVSKMAEVCDKNGINFNIEVYGKVDHINMHESALCSAIETIFNYIFDEVMRCSEKEITIEVCSDNQGVSIAFDSNVDMGLELNQFDDQNISCSNLNRKYGQAEVLKIIEKNKNVIFNSYIDNDHYRQEIMIL